MSTTLIVADPRKIASESPHSVDQILSNELLQLSLRDRNAIDEEIHGVSTCAPQESPRFIEAALRELSEEIDAIPDDCPSKLAYLESQEFAETYVNTSGFRLRFLRCELFDAKKAAIRMLNYLGLALDIVGFEVLQRPFRITDFSKEELRDIQIGNLQLLPFRDRSGRPIFTWVGDFGAKQGTVKSRTKMMLYFLYAMSDDLETQRKGIVMLAWVGSPSQFPRTLPAWENMEHQARLMEAMPIRICCQHFCVPDTPLFRVFRAMVALCCNRIRLKFHVGKETELFYTLKTFGIPVELIPVTGTGNIKTVYLKQWIRLRKYIEDTSGIWVDDGSIVERPGSVDVIFRTGLSLTCHPGNSMFQSMIESKMHEHFVATQVRKIEIVKEIIDMVKQKEGRFLIWDSRGWWTELVDASKIHRKVAVSVKDFRTKSVAQWKRQTFESSTFAFQNQDGKRRKIRSTDSPNTVSCCV